ncbi:NAD(P)-binding protein [Dothidotthia symphoricarpi CBS 119687]|uniref:NAD(P)-binding protein n=1 Tax=Dothidotthia symphoricarpi CBS 119687 TaxID=1392245 RepID=A0A6A6AEP8_9PLEO|nr:NAD(P)-binding protein [Dothidotthia symphoricarpi CBS 119687]KAF2130369.1 NAD(P)-binding protein [Dothidotthia symphoricarpi CBS 119687]
MSHSILITGASGYLGGSLLVQLNRAKLPPHKTLYALVRSQEQADAVKEYGAEPLFLDLKDQDRVIKTIVDAKITVIFFLVDAVTSNLQIPMIKALGQVKKQTGEDVHFLHTSGAKIFSQHSNYPTDKTILDSSSEVYEFQKSSKAPYDMVAQAMTTNNTVIETAESYGVYSYIFIPCIVYGESEGFGNRISIQSTAVVRAAKKAGAVYDVNSGGATWPVCHVSDNTALYVKLLEKILSGDNPGHGKNGYYLASSGSVAWIDIYTAFARALATRNVIDSAEVKKPDETALEKMAQALYCPKEMIVVQLGGTCTLKADRASKIGWKPKYAPEHILEVADAEVELILKHLKD